MMTRCCMTSGILLRPPRVLMKRSTAVKWVTVRGLNRTIYVARQISMMHQPKGRKRHTSNMAKTITG